MSWSIVGVMVISGLVSTMVKMYHLNMYKK